MPFSAQDLLQIDDKPSLVTVYETDSVKEALDLMLEHTFSQLPVVDNDGYPIGIVTNDAILQGLSVFRSSLDNLVVRDVREAHKQYLRDDDLFDVLRGLEDVPAVLICDLDGKLTGIVTHYDTTQYFRRRAQDIMLVEDVESLLKEHIAKAFTNRETGEVEQEVQIKAIAAITNSTSNAYRSLKRAIRQYLNARELPQGNDGDLIRDITEDVYGQSGPAKTFDDLTLAQYTDLLFFDEVWKTYSENFNLDKSNIRHLLDEARKIRNKLAHFRDDLTNSERRLLQQCVNWLDRHLPEIDVPTESETASEVTEEIMPIEEEVPSGGSRYAKLAVYLQGQSGKINKLDLSYEEIEQIIEHELPSSAYSQRAWWANDTVGHTQSRQWLSAGWRVSSVRMRDHSVTFTRIKEREHRYIRFYSELRDQLIQAFPELGIEPRSHQATSWMTTIPLPRPGKQYAVFSFAFTHGNRYRVELYIDTGDKAANKSVFDELRQDSHFIEHKVGMPLEWERLDNKQSSRIAIYRDGSITDDENTLAEIRSWSLDAFDRLYGAIAEQASALLDQVEAN